MVCRWSLYSPFLNSQEYFCAASVDYSVSLGLRSVCLYLFTRSRCGRQVSVEMSVEMSWGVVTPCWATP